MSEWGWSSSGMILTRETRNTETKTCPSATFSTANPAWTSVGFNLDLWGERAVINHLNHGTVTGDWHSVPCIAHKYLEMWLHNCCKHSCGAVINSAWLKTVTNYLSWEWWNRLYFLQIPNKFDEETVQRQLRYTGMLETVRIRQAGYNVRLTYDEFIQLYRILLPKGLIRYVLCFFILIVFLTVKPVPVLTIKVYGRVGV